MESREQLSKKIKAQESELHQLRSMIDNLPVAFYWLDKDGYILGVNEVEIKTLSLPPLSELIGRHVIKVADVKLWNNCERVMRQNKAESLEEVVNIAGQKRIYFSIKSPFHDEKGNVVGLVGMSVDITSKRTLEEINTRAKDYVINSMHSYFPANFYWLDRKGIVLGCNENQLREVGAKSLKEVIGKHVSEFSMPETWQNSIEVMEKDLVQEREESYVKANGERVSYLSVKSPLHDEEGEVIGLVGISVNITNRKKAEIELQLAKDAAESANARIKAMAGSIAHELRTPLGTVGMNIGAVDSALADPTEENLSYAHETLASIRKEIESANTVINMLLMNIREDVNWQKEKMEKCSMNQCIEEALNRYPFLEGQKEKVTWKKSKDFEFQGNALFMQHVIFNLLKNALYQINTEGKGDIEIWTEKIGDAFELHFKDTAKGIPADVLPRIFEKFFTNTKKGTGLGLAFCKMVIEAFGGTISCQSEEGKYTEFIVKFENSLNNIIGSK